MAKNNEVISVCRISKCNVPDIATKRMFYYIDKVIDEDDNEKVVYGLVDNRKGKKEIKEFNSIKELEEAIK